jgi:NADH-quinone oxidoreductase subunit L
MTVIILAVLAVGIAVAWLIFGRQPVPVTAPRGSVVTVAARRDLYGDAVNEALLMRPGQYLTRSLVYLDNRGVDGAVLGTAAAMGDLSSRLRRWQTGFVRSYALSMLAGAAIVVVAMLLVRLP